MIYKDSRAKERRKYEAPNQLAASTLTSFEMFDDIWLCDTFFEKKCTNKHIYHKPRP